MSIETIWEDFTSSEKHLFQKSCRRLLKQTFLVRDKDEDYILLLKLICEFAK